MFGAVASWLIITSVLVVWVDRTIISTPTYVSTVTPIILNSNVQNLIANKVANQLITNISINDSSSSLLHVSNLNIGTSATQLENLAQPLIQSDIIGILKSSNFYNLWVTTNTEAHTQMIRQLNGDSPVLNLNFNPAVNGIVSELKATQLKPIASQINISSNTGNFVIRGEAVKMIRYYYNIFQLRIVEFIILSIFCFVLAILMAVNRRRTLRRLLRHSGFLALFGALTLYLVKWIPIGGLDRLTVLAVRSIYESLTHYLLISYIVVGITLVIASYIIDFLWERFKNRPKHDNNDRLKEFESLPNIS